MKTEGKIAMVRQGVKCILQTSEEYNMISAFQIGLNSATVSLNIPLVNLNIAQVILINALFILFRPGWG